MFHVKPWLEAVVRQCRSEAGCAVDVSDLQVRLVHRVSRRPWCAWTDPLGSPGRESGGATEEASAKHRANVWSRNEQIMRVPAAD
jgi:hypothetical protein